MRKKDEEEVEKIANGQKDFVPSLFVTGTSPNSIRAITNVKELCEAHFPNRYSLEIIDIYQQDALAQKEQIIALPVLVIKKPLPGRKLIGDMSDTKKILKALGLPYQ